MEISSNFNYASPNYSTAWGLIFFGDGTYPGLDTSTVIKTSKICKLFHEIVFESAHSKEVNYWKKHFLEQFSYKTDHIDKTDIAWDKSFFDSSKELNGWIKLTQSKTPGKLKDLLEPFLTSLKLCSNPKVQYLVGSCINMVRGFSHDLKEKFG